MVTLPAGSLQRISPETVNKINALIQANPFVEDIFQNLIKEKKSEEVLESEYTDIMEKIETTQVYIDKEAYRKLLNKAMKKAETNKCRAKDIVPALINLNIVDKSEIKEQYKVLLDKVMKQGELNGVRALQAIPNLINLKILDISDREYCKKLLEAAMKAAETNDVWLQNTLPALINLEIVEKSEIKDQYKLLLEKYMEMAKNDRRIAAKITNLINLNILDISDKKYYKQLLEKAIKESELNSTWASQITPALINLNILDISDKEYCTELLKKILKETETTGYWSTTIGPALMNLNIVDKSEIKEQYKKGLERVMKEAETNDNYALNITTSLIVGGILDVSDRKYYKDLLVKAIKKAETNMVWAASIVPALLHLNIIEKSEIKEQYKDLLDKIIKNGELSFVWARDIVPVLISLGILDISDKEYCKKLLDKAMKQAKTDFNRAKNIVPVLIRLNIVDKSEIKRQFKVLLEEAMKTLETNNDWRYIVIKRTNLEIVDKKEIKEQYKKLLDIAMKKAETDITWAGQITPALINLNILDISDKEYYKIILDKIMVKAEKNIYCAQYILPALINLNIVDKSEIKEQFKILLEVVIKKVDQNIVWVKDILPVLINLNIVDKIEIKDQFKILLETKMKRSENPASITLILPVLLSLNIVEKSEIKEQYMQLLDVAIKKAENDDGWAQEAVPILLGFNVREKSDKKIQTQHILHQDKIDKILEIYGFIGCHIEKNSIDGEYLDGLIHIARYFSEEEKNIIIKESPEIIQTLYGYLQTKNYQALTFYKIEHFEKNDTDKRRFRDLRNYFGDEIYLYIYDSLHDKIRPIHDAAEQSDNLIALVNNLIMFGKTNKEEFIKNILKKTAHSNSGYYELNQFLTSWNFHRQRNLKNELSDPKGIQDPSFQENARYVLAQDESGELYRSLDGLQKLQNILRNLHQKDALRQLNTLFQSPDLKDKKLYEYYKSGVFNLRDNVPDLFLKMHTAPEEFLGLDDDTLGVGTIQENKKPTHMVTDFPHLDFTPEELTSCLPLGVYEQISYFQPKQVVYYTTSKQEVYTQTQIVAEVKDFLVTFDTNKVKSKIINTYPEILTFKNFIQDIQKLSDVQCMEILDILIKSGMQKLNIYKDLTKFTAEITPKSDASNWFNGFNCDKLAPDHGKKVVAMFNPYCIDFCVYQGEKSDKIDNLKVTSRVTLNRTINKFVPELIRKLKKTPNPNIAQELGEEFKDIKDAQEYIITMDNIEADPNFEQRKSEVIRKIYQDFFSTYIQEHPVSPNGVPINTSKYFCGEGFNKIKLLQATEANKNIPVFVNSYTDNSEETTLVGKLTAGEQAPLKKKTGAQDMSIEDVIPITYMEHRTYPEGIKTHVGNLQHEITAMTLNNTLKGRKNISLSYYNAEGKMVGYILAYQGKGAQNNKPCIYISDIAVMQEYQGQMGGRLLLAWINQLQKAGLDNLPIVANARETTSYLLIKERVEKFGLSMVYDERYEKKVAGEFLHNIVLVKNSDHISPEEYDNYFGVIQEDEEEYEEENRNEDQYENEDQNQNQNQYEHEDE